MTGSDQMPYKFDFTFIKIALFQIQSKAGFLDILQKFGYVFQMHPPLIGVHRYIVIVDK